MKIRLKAGGRAVPAPTSELRLLNCGFSLRGRQAVGDELWAGGARSRFRTAASELQVSPTRPAGGARNRFRTAASELRLSPTRADGARSRFRTSAPELRVSPARPAPSLSMGRAVRAFRARSSRNITGMSRSCCGIFPHAIAATFGNITPRVPPLPRPPFNTRVAVIRGKRRAHPVGMSRQSRGEVEAIRWRAVRAKHWFFWKIRAYYPANYME